MSEQTEITPEQIEAYQRKQQAALQQAAQQLVSELQSYASERGFVIFAMPRIEDGRIVADWGVQRK